MKFNVDLYSRWNLITAAPQRSDPARTETSLIVWLFQIVTILLAKRRHECETRMLLILLCVTNEWWHHYDSVTTDPSDEASSLWNTLRGFFYLTVSNVMWHDFLRLSVFIVLQNRCTRLSPALLRWRRQVGIRSTDMSTFTTNCRDGGPRLSAFPVYRLPHRTNAALDWRTSACPIPVSHAVINADGKRYTCNVSFVLPVSSGVVGSLLLMLHAERLAAMQGPGQHRLVSDAST